MRQRLISFVIGKARDAQSDSLALTAWVGLAFLLIFGDVRLAAWKLCWWFAAQFTYRRMLARRGSFAEGIYRGIEFTFGAFERKLYKHVYSVYQVDHA